MKCEFLEKVNEKADTKCITMNSLANLLSTYSGRDCAMRTLSYLTLYLSGQTGGSVSRKLKTVSNELSHARMILRLFDDFPMLQLTLKYGLGKEEEGLLLRCLGILRNVVDQIYYPVEHIAWAAEKRLLRVRSSSWFAAGSLLWALSSYISLVRCLLMMSALQKKTYGLKNVIIHENILQEQLELLLSAFKEIANFIMAVNYLPPGSLLWAGKLNSKQIGMCGLISSLLRIIMMFRSIAEQPEKKFI